MKEIIKTYLSQQEKKRIPTKAIEAHLLETLGKKVYWDKGGYPALAESLEALVEESLLRPIKAWKTNGLKPALYHGYQIIEKSKLEREEMKKILTSFHPAIDTASFIAHYEEYERYAPYLLALDRFLKENHDLKNTPPLTVNERSFQIFFHEKWLASREGSLFLNRISMTYQDLHCYPTYEPFFFFQKRTIKRRVVALIIENKDTFYSLKRLFQQGFSSFGGEPFNLLIFGEGNKITRSFSYYNELEQFQDLPASFWYFGDLDPEGIRIWYRLKERMEEDIRPFPLFYQCLIDRQKRKGRSPTTSQRPLPEQVEKKFLSFFPLAYQREIQSLFQRGEILPQEGLHYLFLEELAHVEQRDDQGF